jgi:predicted  nucleic acid-binding Zn-ribbon protein
MGLVVANTGYSAGIRRTYGPQGLYGYADGAFRDMPMTLGDAPVPPPAGVTVSPDGTVFYFRDGSFYDSTSGDTFDAAGNLVSSGGPTTAQTQQLQSTLSQAASDLQTLSDSAAQNSAVAAKINSELDAANAQLQQLFQQFQGLNSWWQTLLSGTFPPYGLYNAYEIGQVISQAAALRQSIANMQQEVASIQGQQVSITSASATQYSALAAAAYGAGNKSLGDQYATLAASAQKTALNQSTSPSPAAGFLAWLQANALWVGIGAAAIVIGPTLVKKL